MDAGNTAFALLFTALVICVVAIMTTCSRVEKNTSQVKSCSIFSTFLVSVFTAAGFSAWYQQCYINNWQSNVNALPSYRDLHTFIGFNCACAALALAGVAMFINCFLPTEKYDQPNGDVYFDNVPAGTGNDPVAKTDYPVAQGSPHIVQGRVVGV